MVDECIQVTRTFAGSVSKMNLQHVVMLKYGFDAK
jgi:hypothetical protein